MKYVKDISASVLARLKNLIRKKNLDFQFILSRYATERFLQRLSKSPYKEKFVLKGAMLFLVWKDQIYRPTRDIDFLGYGNGSDEFLKNAVEDICAIDVEADGISFLLENLQIYEIRENQEHEGKRIIFEARIGTTRIPMQLDIAFGDALIEGPEEKTFPTLLDTGKPIPVLTYAKEAVVAEKIQAMVKLGIINSRMKDYFDVYVLMNSFAFEKGKLAAAIEATFNRRKTAIPEDIPMGLSEEFSLDKEKIKQWESYSKKVALPVQDSFDRIIKKIQDFTLPVFMYIQEAAEEHTYWKPGGPWEQK